MKDCKENELILIDIWKLTIWYPKFNYWGQISKSAIKLLSSCASHIKRFPNHKKETTDHMARKRHALMHKTPCIQYETQSFAFSHFKSSSAAQYIISYRDLCLLFLFMRLSITISYLKIYLTNIFLFFKIDYFKNIHCQFEHHHLDHLSLRGANFDTWVPSSNLFSPMYY